MKAMDELIELVAKLRSPEGCPWDREQTPESLVRYILEEAYELVAAIESGNSAEWKEELGDYLFQVVLQAQIAQERGQFDFSQVARALTEKMTRRHPHVFGNEKWATAEEVVKNWQARKELEKHQARQNLENQSARPASQTQSALKSPDSQDGPEAEEYKMPALMASHKIGKNSEKWKFDWDTPEQVFAKVEEEMAEVHEVLDSGHPATQSPAAAGPTDSPRVRGSSKSGTTPTPESSSLKRDSAPESIFQERLEEEFGDFLFAASQWARHLKIDPETALRKANRKYQLRFRTMIQDCELSQAEFAALPLERKEDLWQQTKKKLKK